MRSDGCVLNSAGPLKEDEPRRNLLGASASVSPDLWISRPRLSVYPERVSGNDKHRARCFVDGGEDRVRFGITLIGGFKKRLEEKAA